MIRGRDHTRVLMYSHDTFGLGHLRRTRAIAHALVKRNKNMSVLILTGSPIIGSFDFRSRVDFVRIPGVIKLRSGEYTPLKLHIDIKETLSLRESIIKNTADAFDPDLFIVDKEPLGLHGEVASTLEMLKERGTPLILGLRDVMDDPDLLGPEWARKNAMPALENLYDHIWVYGLPQIHEPLKGLSLPLSVKKKMSYTGYLKRKVAEELTVHPHVSKISAPYILVTPGGGGDGENMIDWVLRTYEADPDIPHPALLVLGPFMQSERQSEFMQRVELLDNVEAITFESHMESLMASAVGVVAMGGYNTFCEILSLDKRAIIIPRTKPRMEQFIRTSRAQDLGLLCMLEDDGIRSVKTMMTALRQLPQQQKPSDVVIPGLLSGLENMNILAMKALDQPTRSIQLLESAHGS